MANAQIPNLENVGDILKSLKESGMMDNFEKDLKQMLFQQVNKTTFFLFKQNKKPELLKWLFFQEAFVKPKEKSQIQVDEVDVPQQVDTYEFIKVKSD